MSTDCYDKYLNILTNCCGKKPALLDSYFDAEPMYYVVCVKCNNRTREDSSAISAMVEWELMRCKGKCSHDPRAMAGKPIGQYHCPECGKMVIAGMPHDEEGE